jgi:F-type H+-transporting ATPase subunit epsilon
VAELPKSFHLTIVTRERKILETDAVEAVLPAADGEIGVLPGHAPLLATLRVGVMRYRDNGHQERLVLSWGFAEVLPDRVIVMAETAKLASEIDIDIATADRSQLEKELADLSSHDPEFARVEARLEESIAAISIHHG